MMEKRDMIAIVLLLWIKKQIQKRGMTIYQNW